MKKPTNEDLERIEQQILSKVGQYFSSMKLPSGEICTGKIIDLATIISKDWGENIYFDVIEYLQIETPRTMLAMRFGYYKVKESKKGKFYPHWGSQWALLENVETIKSLFKNAFKSGMWFKKFMAELVREFLEAI